MEFIKNNYYSENILSKIGKQVIGDEKIYDNLSLEYLSMHYLNSLFSIYSSDFKNINISNIETKGVSRRVAALSWMKEINKNNLVNNFLCWFLNNYLAEKSNGLEEYENFSKHTISSWNWILNKSNLEIFKNKEGKYYIDIKKDNFKEEKDSFKEEKDISNNKENKILFLMSFSDSQKLKYDTFKNQIQENNIDCVRVDEILIEETITEKILEQIKRSKLCIFDISDSNPNVMFELGYAIGIGSKKMIIKNNKDTKNPFNISNYQIHYIKEDAAEIKKFVNEILVPYYRGLD